MPFDFWLETNLVKINKFLGCDNPQEMKPLLTMDPDHQIHIVQRLMEHPLSLVFRAEYVDVHTFYSKKNTMRSLDSLLKRIKAPKTKDPPLREKFLKDVGNILLHGMSLDDANKRLEDLNGQGPRRSDSVPATPILASSWIAIPPSLLRDVSDAEKLEEVRKGWLKGKKAKAKEALILACGIKLWKKFMKMMVRLEEPYILDVDRAIRAFEKLVSATPMYDGMERDLEQLNNELGQQFLEA